MLHDDARISRGGARRQCGVNLEAPDIFKVEPRDMIFFCTYVYQGGF